MSSATPKGQRRLGTELAAVRVAQLCSEQQPRLRRCLLLTPDFPPELGGIATYLHSVYSRLDLHDMTLVAPTCGNWEAFDAAQDYRAQRFVSAPRTPGLWGAWYLYNTYRRARRLCRADQKLPLHCGHIMGAMVARRIKARHGNPYLVWTHALEIMDEWMRHEVTAALRQADLIITNSEFTRTFIESAGVKRERVVKIRPGTDPVRFRPGLDSRELVERLGIGGRRILLSVGAINRTHRYKGRDMVIRALPQIVKAVPDLLFVIAGAGDDTRYLLDLARDQQVTNHVRIVGRVSNADLPLLINACHAFTMCSRQEQRRRGVLAEGFGIVFLEASACGKPVVGGLSGGVPDAIRDGVTGLLVDPNAPQAIAQAIIRVFCEPGLAEQLGANGRAWVEAEMNWERAARQLEAAIREFMPEERA